MSTLSCQIIILEKEEDFVLGIFGGTPGQNSWFFGGNTTKFDNFKKKDNKEKILVS